MTDRPASTAAPRRPRLPWMVFSGVTAVALGACLYAAADTGDRTDVGLTLLGGLIVIGIAAALLGAMLTPLPDRPVGARSSRSWWGGGGIDAGGWSDGGYGGGGGDGGGGG